MKLAIYSAATTGYTHALTTQAACVIASIRSEVRMKGGEALFILVTDDRDNPDIVSAMELYQEAFPESKCKVIAHPAFVQGAPAEGFENYKADAQLLIAQMRTAATRMAVAWDADYLWALDSDVLPPHNALRCMVDAVNFDGGTRYQVSFCPYNSQGGGPFLGGFGSRQNHIFDNYHEDEKDIPKELLDERAALEEEFKTAVSPRREEVGERCHEIAKIIRDIPPVLSMWAGIEKNGWTQRGWYDFAYPGVGEGAIVPGDWIGFGCTLMTKVAMGTCDFTGYTGGGTEDLFICYEKWQPAGIRIALVPHAPCDHVVRKTGSKTHHVHIRAFHEPSGPCKGHLRSKHAPWHPHAPGERPDPENDGKMQSPTKSKPEKRQVKKREPLKISNKSEE